VLKTGAHRHMEILVPEVSEPTVDSTDLYNRCRARWAKRRTDIEWEIQQRTRIDAGRQNREALDGWE